MRVGGARLKAERNDHYSCEHAPDHSVSVDTPLDARATRRGPGPWQGPLAGLWSKSRDAP